MLVIKRSATYLKDLKISRHFPRVQANLQTQSLVPTCRKNGGFSASGVCECILNKPKYGTNIRLPMQRYTIHLITSARRSHRLFLSLFSTWRLCSRDAKRKQESGKRDWLKLAGEKIRRDCSYFFVCSREQVRQVENRLYDKCKPGLSCIR